MSPDGEEWHDIDPGMIYEILFGFKRIIDLHGRVLRAEELYGGHRADHGFTFSEDEMRECLIQNYEDRFEDADCGESNYTGYMATSVSQPSSVNRNLLINLTQGPDATHWYRTTVRISFLVHDKPRISTDDLSRLL